MIEPNIIDGLRGELEHMLQQHVEEKLAKLRSDLSGRLRTAGADHRQYADAMVYVDKIVDLVRPGVVASTTYEMVQNLTRNLSVEPRNGQ